MGTEIKSITFELNYLLCIKYIQSINYIHMRFRADYTYITDESGSNLRRLPWRLLWITKFIWHKIFWRIWLYQIFDSSKYFIQMPDPGSYNFNDGIWILVKHWNSLNLELDFRPNYYIACKINEESVNETVLAIIKWG